MLARWDCVILGCNSTPVMILKIMRTMKGVFLRRSKTHNQKVLPRVKTECETVTWDLALFFFASLLLWLARESNVCLTCHVISQSAFTRRESNFGANNVPFDINFREKKIFKYVHVQKPLPKKDFKCVFFRDEILLAEAAVPLFNNYKYEHVCRFCNL